MVASYLKIKKEILRKNRVINYLKIKKLALRINKVISYFKRKEEIKCVKKNIFKISFFY